MPRQNFQVNENAHIEIRACEERVTVIGWDDAQTIAVDGEARQEGNTIFVEKLERVTLRVPRAATVLIRDCEADVRVEGLRGRVELASIEGDVVLRELQDVLARDLDGALVAKDVVSLKGEGTWDGDVALRGVEQLAADEIEGDASMGSLGTANIKTLGGDLAARGIRGALALGDVAGDVSLRDVAGQLSIERVGGDLAASDVRGALDAQDIEGDAVITFAQVAETKLRADGDVVIRLPEGANAEIELDALRGDLMVSGAVQVREQDDSHLRGTLGSGGVKIQAESTRGDLVLNAGEVERGRAERHEHWQGEDWGGFGRRIADEVRENVFRSLGNMRVQARVTRHREHRHGRHAPDATREPSPRPRGPVAGSPERQAILDAISRGELSVDDAIKKLRGE
ncbi:MAG: DUF4097 family beta strand repeat protein [Chloroflexi bacterium]|nr:DUF4097 family beta strand repeat protein [Chloroflexota bacterium]